MPTQARWTLASTPPSLASSVSDSREISSVRLDECRSILRRMTKSRAILMSARLGEILSGLESRQCTIEDNSRVQGARGTRHGRAGQACVELATYDARWAHACCAAGHTRCKDCDERRWPLSACELCCLLKVSCDPDNAPGLQNRQRARGPDTWSAQAAACSSGFDFMRSAISWRRGSGPRALSQLPQAVVLPRL
jgi:hypothetical protein